MAYELNKKLKSVEPYEPICESCGVRLDANESCFDLTDEIKEDIAKAVKNIEFNRYPDSCADEVTKAFADYYGIEPSRCTAGNGSDELISLILGSCLEKGDNVLALSPDFSMYAFYSFMDELTIKTMQKEDDLKISIGRVIEYCNNNDIKAVIFSNPCNPTSLGVTRQDIIRLVKNVFCLVIIDEAYMDFWSESVIDMTEEMDNLIVLKTCSKNMGLASLRLGFAVASERMTNALKAVKSPYNVDSFTQAAGTAVLRKKEFIKKRTSELVESRKFLQNALIELSDRFFTIEKVYDSVTNFVFVRSNKSKIIYEKLLEQGVAVRYMGNYFRVTAGTEEENKIFLETLKSILSLM